MKKSILKAAVICIFGILSGGFGKVAVSQDYSVDNPFVYMRDNKFYYRGEEFFVKACNYMISIHLNNGQLIVGPHYNYFALWSEPGPQYPTNQTDASNYLRAHFKLLKDMGFNTIRLMNCMVEPRWDSDVLTTRLWYRNSGEVINQNPDPAYDYFKANKPRNFEILYDLATENGTEYYKQAMQIVLEAAQEYDMKVIWVLGRDTDYPYVVVHDEDDPSENDTLVEHHSILTDVSHPINLQFISFLYEVVTEFKDNSALFCYDFYNEIQTYNDSGDNEDNYYNISNSFKTWTNVLKMNDKNHYSTAGFVSYNQFFTLGVETFKHCDAYSFHIYDGEYARHNTVNADETDRSIYYFSRAISDHPWMIGECGKETAAPSDEGKQNEYAVKTSVQTKTCGGAGYSWWEMYDPGWATFGLLKRNGTYPVQISANPAININVFGTPKAIVAPVNDNVFHDVDNIDGDCYFNTDLYYNFFPFVSHPDDAPLRRWEGNVTDQDNHAIADAIVKIRVVYEGSARDFFTFTHENGNYMLEIPTTDNSAIISVSKYGYDVKTRNVAGCVQYTNNGPWHCYFSNFQLEPSNLPATDVYVQPDVVIAAGETKVIDRTMFKSDIKVMNGGTMIVQDTLAFDENHGILVWPGGKVVLNDGAALTAIHDEWKGVKLMGDMSADYIEFTTTGNNAIAKSTFGIVAENNVKLNINGTDFVNNVHDITATNVQYNINVKNSDFITLPNANSVIAGYYASFENCGNVTVDNCNFIDERQLEHGPKKGGIVSKEDVLVVKNTSASRRNTFQNLRYGIYANTCRLNASKTDFADNLHDILAISLSGTSVFDNCNFTVGENAPVDNMDLNYNVKITYADIVKFYRCNFADNSVAAQESPLKYGICASGVNNLVVGPSPVINVPRTTFTNLKMGIYANAVGSNKSISIKQTDFVCSRGLYMFGYSGLGSVKVTGNNFSIKNYDYTTGNVTKTQVVDPDNVPHSDPVDPVPTENQTRSYGIYVDGFSNNYQIEGNTFASENAKYNRFGVIHKNNGPIPNELYRNNFSNLENAVQSIGRNKETTPLSTAGLQIRCNNFQDIRNDIYVTKDPEYLYTDGIALSQGSLTEPAANLFSTDAGLLSNINNYEMSQVNYYHRNSGSPGYNLRERPEIVTISTVNRIGILYGELSSVCLDKTTNKLPVAGDELIRAYASLSAGAQIESTLEGLVDGGNTDLTVAEVVLADDNTAWQAYLSLMEKSPYLSDTVLKDVALKEYGLTAPMVRDVLVANPQAAKSKEIEKILDERIAELPDYMIEQIKSGLTQVSPKEYLEYQKAEQDRIFNEAVFNLTGYYYSQKDKLAYAGDSIVKLLGLKKEPAYMLILADYYMSEGNPSKATGTLSLMQSELNLSRAESEEVQNLAAFYNYYNEILSDTSKNIISLDSTSLAVLRGFEEGGGTAGDKARALLMLNNATDYMEPVYMPEMIIVPKSVSANFKNTADDGLFAIYPNPANEYFNLKYSVPELSGTVQLVITDNLGRVVCQQQLYNLQDIIIVKTDYFAEGNYNCSIFNNKKRLYNEKITIKR